MHSCPAAVFIRPKPPISYSTNTSPQIIEQTKTDTGGCKFASAAFSGPGAFLRLRHEAGVHRVQRVPATEKEGRIHTSTASVVVMPEADEVRSTPLLSYTIFTLPFTLMSIR